MQESWFVTFEFVFQPLTMRNSIVVLQKSRNLVQSVENLTDNQNFVVEACIDNLIKGASGNAVECMNLMFSEDQSLGLKEMLPLYL